MLGGVWRWTLGVGMTVAAPVSVSVLTRGYKFDRAIRSLCTSYRKCPSAVSDGPKASVCASRTELVGGSTGASAWGRMVTGRARIVAAPGVVLVVVTCSRAP